jgi:hypothetical protein
MLSAALTHLVGMIRNGDNINDIVFVAHNFMKQISNKDPGWTFIHMDSADGSHIFCGATAMPIIFRNVHPVELWRVPPPGIWPPTNYLPQCQDALGTNNPIYGNPGAQKKALGKMKYFMADLSILDSTWSSAFTLAQTMRQSDDAHLQAMGGFLTHALLLSFPIVANSTIKPDHLVKTLVAVGLLVRRKPTKFMAVTFRRHIEHAFHFMVYDESSATLMPKITSELQKNRYYLCKILSGEASLPTSDEIDAAVDEGIEKASG